MINQECGRLWLEHTGAVTYVSENLQLAVQHVNQVMCFMAWMMIWLPAFFEIYISCLVNFLIAIDELGASDREEDYRGGSWM